MPGFYGPCIRLELMCDGFTDCLDGAEEIVCGK